MVDRAYIVQLLATNDQAVGRALVVLAQRQTITERTIGAAVVNNGEGFTPADAYMGTSMAQHYERTGRLSEKQLAYWRKPNAKGVLRIVKYATQLLEISRAKQQECKAITNE